MANEYFETVHCNYDDEIQFDLPDMGEILDSLADDEPTHDCVCLFCGKKNFTGYRYKCCMCADCDLCSECYENKKVPQGHKLGDLMVRYDEPGKIFDDVEAKRVNLASLQATFGQEVHVDIKCDVCDVEPIQGLRVKCETCKIDICMNCYKKKKNHSSHSYVNHQMIVIGKDIDLRVDFKDIQFKREIGQGSFGVVYKAVYKNKKVACKKINVNFLRLFYKLNDAVLLCKSYSRELNAYNNIKGENVLKMIGYCRVEDENCIDMYILTEYMPKGSLKKVLSDEPDLSYRRRLFIALDIACGMSRIHDLNFIHRDIRLENILIDSNYRAKIGDMGIAKEFDENTINSLIGCRKYMPPEFYEKKVTQKLDVFTFGLTLNELFDGSHVLKAFTVSVDKKAKVFYYFVVKCVDKDPNRRPSAKNIENALKAFQLAMNQCVKDMIRKYDKMNSVEKNKIFCQIYNACLKVYIENGETFPVKDSYKKKIEPEKDLRPELPKTSSTHQTTDQNSRQSIKNKDCCII